MKDNKIDGWHFNEIMEANDNGMTLKSAKVKKKLKFYEKMAVKCISKLKAKTKAFSDKQKLRKTFSKPLEL